MSDMVERVARAIDPEAFEPPLPGHTEGLANFYAVCRNRQNQRALERARAAIEAMREPTDGVMRIVREKHGFQDASIYSKFIDAALKGETE